LGALLNTNSRDVLRTIFEIRKKCKRASQASLLKKGQRITILRNRETVNRIARGRIRNGMQEIEKGNVLSADDCCR
jgi:hypothetical protein